MQADICTSMIVLDGSQGEGGGQIVRTALALSALTGKPFTVEKIRQGREVPGLKAQHVHGTIAAQRLCSADVQGAVVGSQKLEFIPKKLSGGKIEINIGTAGSITLLLQSILLPALFCPKRTAISITGGTDVAWSMPSDYVKELLVPQLTRFCERLECSTPKRGYYPVGGGRIELAVTPKWKLKDYDSFPSFIESLRTEALPYQLTEQGHLVKIGGVSHASHSLEQARVSERQAAAAKLALERAGINPGIIDIREEYNDTLSAGSGITLWAVCSKDKDDIDPKRPIRLGADKLGEKGVPAESVGTCAAQQLLSELNSKAAVDRHLADNLVPFMALVGNSAIRTSEITQHCRTNIDVVEAFLGKMFTTNDAERIIRTA